MQKLCIVFAASEAIPFVKTGGLADVVFALTSAFAAEGHDVRLFLPRYWAIDRDKYECSVTGGPLGVPIGSGERWAAIYETAAIHGVKTYFIDHEEFFGRAGLYDDGYQAFGDNAERFTFFNRAVMQSCLALRISPDIMHCNDWQTSLIPIYLKTLYRNHSNFAKTRSVLTIHNIGYQGVFDKHEILHSQLGWESFNDNCLKFYDSINFMKGGLLWADAITTVSKRYAEEIKTPEFGYDLASILDKRSNQLFGITNGVDYGSWNPASDKIIPVKYSSSKMHGKIICKEYLQNEMKLRVNPDIPLLATISRITHQKGIDVLVEALDNMRGRELFQFVLLGSGDKAILDRFERLCSSDPTRFALCRGYDEKLAHRIEAGADIYAMPSRYEPCGLNQMYSLHYGTIPVVRATGGLDDTIDEWDPNDKSGTGFKFDTLTAENLVSAIERALSLYKKKDEWEIIRRNAMKYRQEWADAVKEYEHVYNELIHGADHIL